MVFSLHKPHWTPLERHQIRALIVRDTLALLSIFLIAVLLAIATYLLFNSYSDHRKELAARWYRRGQAAMQAKQPLTAMEDFHSALLYAPGDRQMEIALATALAAAGRIQEATAYFTTLRDAEPGNGEINLQLARLAVRAGNEDIAKHDFHAAIYGNWEGDGYLQRRSARLELVRYLVGRGRFDQARSELLVASGNAPSSDLDIQTQIAALLVAAHAPGDALTLYRQLIRVYGENVQALKGAATTAYTVGQYEAAYRYLDKAVNAPGYSSEDAAARAADQALLRRAARIIVLDPASNLPPATLATRLLNDRQIARQSLLACIAAQTTVALPPALGQLASQWQAEPPHLTARMLLADPAAEERQRTLINQTEIITAQVCGAPSNLDSDDAVLLRLAQVPSGNDTSLEPDHE